MWIDWRCQSVATMFFLGKLMLKQHKLARHRPLRKGTVGKPVPSASLAVSIERLTINAQKSVCPLCLQCQFLEDAVGPIN